jgi:hypothetical protein
MLLPRQRRIECSGVTMTAISIKSDPLLRTLFYGSNAEEELLRTTLRKEYRFFPCGCLNPLHCPLARCFNLTRVDTIMLCCGAKINIIFLTFTCICVRIYICKSTKSWTADFDLIGLYYGRKEDEFVTATIICR